MCDSLKLCTCSTINQPTVCDKEHSDSYQPCSPTYIVSINNEFDDVAGVGGQRADGRFRNEIFQLLKETKVGGENREKDWRMSSSAQTHKVHLVDRLEFLRDSKDSLNVVVTQFLNQMGDGGVVL